MKVAWKVRAEGQEPDPEVEKAIEAAARVAVVVDQATAHVPLGTRVVAFAGLLGIAAARADAALEPVLDLIRSFYQEERERITRRGH